ncbi:MAG: low molecular weight phosphatase family protein [Pyrinomonadaceae bacterium]|nr:low molecular weight phosphatase family protein [Pyrinomonadaceae bacterium]
MKQKVLFLCTGNYYRSRFAEILFNDLAQKFDLEWQADSRGLMIELGHSNIGAISPYAVKRLEEIGVPLPEPTRLPASLTDEDLQKSDLIIAMYDNEHRPMVSNRFPSWLEKVEFWKVPDVHEVSSATALPNIEAQVKSLVEQLKSVGGEAVNIETSKS